MTSPIYTGEKKRYMNQKHPGRHMVTVNYKELANNVSWGGPVETLDVNVSVTC